MKKSLIFLGAVLIIAGTMLAGCNDSREEFSTMLENDSLSEKLTSFSERVSEEISTVKENLTDAAETLSSKAEDLSEKLSDRAEEIMSGE